MDADRSAPGTGPDPWATGRRRSGRPDRGARPFGGRDGAGPAPARRQGAGSPTADEPGPSVGSGSSVDPGSPVDPGSAVVPASPAAPVRRDPGRPAGPGRLDAGRSGSAPRTDQEHADSGPRADVGRGGSDDPGDRAPGDRAPGDRAPGDRGPGDRDPWQHWRKLRPRTVRGATALGIVGAALLLFPFLDDPDRWWVPVGLGFGTLVLLALLRLDRMLAGWAPHVAGLVLVGALVHGTARNPWAWGLALAAGVVVAGLLLLPRWKVLAVGTALLVLAGAGYTFRSVEIREQQAQLDAQAGAQFRTALGVDRPQLALVSLDTGVAGPNPARVCRLAQDGAIDQLRTATGAATCEDAVAVLHARMPAGAEVTSPDREPDPVVAPGGTTTVDGCGTAWGAAAGAELGRIVLARTEAANPTFQVRSFAPC
ncbi:hypothetical protein WIS52_17205 [Pseudonocardia nematodicida]|uniref:Uncharacterized protein n=1 Tax=Pseudonocardia nematodicida TaxID=1206997 RepID=A0ABV1KFT8_9PSEU